jgi:hypothetical protein
LHDEEKIERQNQLLFAQTTGIPEHDQLILSLFNGRKLQIPQDRVLGGILYDTGSHSGGHCRGQTVKAATASTPPPSQ